MINDQDLPFAGNRTFAVTTAPAMEPVSVGDLKTYARIDGTDEDDLLSSFITAVRQKAELWTGRAFMSQTITLTMDFFASDLVELPLPPLVSVAEVRVGQEDGTWEAIDPSQYYLDLKASPGRLYFVQDLSIPATTRQHAGYEIEYTVGYGNASADVPEAIRQAILFWAAYLYEERVPIGKPPAEAQTLLAGYRVRSYLS